MEIYEDAMQMTREYAANKAAKAPEGSKSCIPPCVSLNKDNIPKVQKILYEVKKHLSSNYLLKNKATDINQAIEYVIPKIN